MNNRIVELDLTRAICVMYIIGIWHLNEYLLPTYHYSGIFLQVLHIVTEAVLATFTFISGYFIAKYEFYSYRDLSFFFKKRFLRFGLLLLISSLSFSLLGWISLSQVFQINLGINLFTNTPVPTLWFFSMIILFYLLTPLLRIHIHSSAISVNSARILAAILLFALMAVYTFLNCSDYRVVLYFPFYYIGLNASRIDLVGGVLSKKVTLAVSILLFIIILIIFIRFECFFLEFTLLGLGTIIIISFSLIFYNSHFRKIIWFVSYSSMVAYLFHRQFFSFARHAYGADYIPLYYALIVLFMTFVSSYYVQKYYNKIID